MPSLKRGGTVFHRITGFDILTALGLDGRARFVMNTTSRAPQMPQSFRDGPGDAVFPSTIISVTINWNANLKLISDAAFVASRRIAPPVGAVMAFSRM